GACLSTALWLAISLGFKYYVKHFTSYPSTYGAIGGVIVMLLWFYVSALAVLVGAELSAEIAHAASDAEPPGAPGSRPAPAGRGPNVDVPMVPAHARPRPRASDWLLSFVVLVEAGGFIYYRFRRLKD